MTIMPLKFYPETTQSQSNHKVFRVKLGIKTILEKEEKVHRRKRIQSKLEVKQSKQKGV